MKQFVVDRLVDRENLCDLEREQGELRKAVKSASSLVVYGPRNSGKTSVVRNVTIEEFRASHRRAFVLFADLLGVRSMESLTARMAASLQRCFAASFPVKGLLESAKRFLGSLRPEVSLDLQTGSPSISLQAAGTTPAMALQSLWEHVARIAREVPSLIVLDEFQDVGSVEEGPAVMRSCLESMRDAPIIILGSKRHMLSRLFASPGAPLAGWGADLEFEPIPYTEYHAYIQERFRPRRLRLSLEQATVLQNDMQRVPEAVNRLCLQILELYERMEVGQAETQEALLRLLENREGRYAAYLSTFSATEERVLCEIARRRLVPQPQSKSFVSALGLSSRAVGQTVRRVWDQGVLERIDGGFRIADPLLAAYLRRYR
jgi:uncharacterized protein